MHARGNLGGEVAEGEGKNGKTIIDQITPPPFEYLE